jgi:hypothetical protein
MRYSVSCSSSGVLRSAQALGSFRSFFEKTFFSCFAMLRRPELEIALYPFPRYPRLSLFSLSSSSGYTLDGLCFTMAFGVSEWVIGDERESESDVRVYD